MPDSVGNGSAGLILPPGMTSLLQQCSGQPQQPLSTPTQIPPLNNNNDSTTTQLYLDMNSLSATTASAASANCLTSQANLSNPATPFAQHLHHNQEMHLLQQQQQQQLAATVAAAAVAAAQQNFHQQQFQQNQLQQQQMQHLQQHLNQNQQMHLQQPQRLAQLSDTMVAFTPQ